MKLLQVIVTLAGLAGGLVTNACDQHANGNQCPDASVEIPRMQVYFSPRGGIQSQLIHMMDNAATSLDIAVYLITSQDLADSIMAAHDRGVRVRMVVDSEACDEISYSRCDALQAAGVEIRRRMTSGIMHNKFLIVDEEIVGTGSANWSNSAEENNNENLLIVESRDLADVYAAEFADLFGT